MGRLRQALQGQKVYLDANIFAANVRAQTGLKLPDAIHTATALTHNCTAMLTNDVGFRRASGFELILLSDWIASSC